MPPPVPERVRPRTHAIVAQILSGAFTDLGVSASLFQGGDLWEPIHVSGVPDTVGFELVHGLEAKRKAYNETSARRARREGKVIIAQHAGFHDVFAPVGAGGRFGILVSGAFALKRPTSADLRSRWRWLTGQSAQLSDPEFARYAEVTLGTAMLEGHALAAFRRLHACLAEVLAGEGDLELLVQEGRALRRELSATRSAEQMWNAVRSMLDEGTWREWFGSYREYPLREFGVKRLPQHVVVGLMENLGQDSDPIEDLLRRDAFQRASVGWVKNRSMVCGRVGDHGVVFLLDDTAAGGRLHAKMAELSQRLGALGRRYGFKLHFGASAPIQPFLLPERYRAALSAAERALTSGEALIFAEAKPEAASLSPLGDLRRELSQAVADSPRLLRARFERYLEAAMVHSGYSLDATRAELEAALDQLLYALRAVRAVEERSFGELRLGIERAASAAVTVGELSAIYRQGMAQIELALERPTEMRKHRSLHRAMAYIRDHFAEPLSLARVSRVAGFAPGYFSKLFARTEHMTFRRYTQRLRIERAKQMLGTTALSTERVGQLCGFPSRHRFSAIFKRFERATPGDFRSRSKRRSS